MRLPKPRTILFLFALVRGNYFLSPLQKSLRARVAWPRRETPAAPVVAIQCVEDYFYFGLFSRIIGGLRQYGPLRVDQYSLRSLRQASSLSLRRFIWNSLNENLLSDWKWRRFYCAFADRTAYCAAGFVAPWTALRLWGAAFRLWRLLEDADGLARLTIRGIWVGDLILDSYIRFKPAAALRLTDLYLLVVIRQALKDLEKAFDYFGKTKPALLLTSYTTYIQHGVPARVAAHLGVKILAFSNMQDWTTEITSTSPWHTRSGASYKQDFSALPGHEEKITAAEGLLEARLRGEIDSATTYMKASAYGQKKDMALDVKGMPVIFLHDFSDSIHIYRWIVFHDFWNWVCFTIDTLKAAGIALAIKPHPNQASDATGAMDLLRAKYRDLPLIPTDISNKQLVEAGMSCAITVYGTVASEMAFMGVPSISCGDSPHISFDFCHTARSPAEYASTLVRHRDLGQSPADMRRESCMFYYMHNLNLDQDRQILRHQMLELRRKLFFVSSPPPLPDILSAIEEFGSGPAFEAFYAGLYRELLGPAQDHLGNHAKK
jgi:hypothetical protein